MAEYAEQGSGQAKAASRYLELSAKRNSYLQEARACAELTIPRLIPPEDVDSGMELVTPAQSDGAKGVNSLTAKILMATVPPNIPVFKLETSEMVDAVMDSQATDDQTKAAMDKSAREIRKNLDRIPRECLRITDVHAHRPKIFEGFKHLVCGGNILFWYLDDKKNYGKMRSVPLSRYVVLRDSLGFVLEVIIKDGLSAANLPPNLKEIVKMTKTAEDILRDASLVKSDSTYTPYALYTYACWDSDESKYNFFQEFCGFIVEGTQGKYTADTFPLAPLRFSGGDGEDYGRGHVEEFRGTLMAIEALAQAETALAISLSEIRWGISPDRKSVV